MKACPKCRTVFDNSHNFCIDCGIELAMASAPPARPVPVVTPVVTQPGPRNSTNNAATVLLAIVVTAVVVAVIMTTYPRLVNQIETNNADSADPQQHYAGQHIIPPEQPSMPSAPTSSIYPMPGQWAGIMTTSKGTIYDFVLLLDFTLPDEMTNRVTGILHQHNRKTGTQADEFLSGTMDFNTGKVVLEGKYFEPWPKGWFLDRLELTIGNDGTLTGTFFDKERGNLIGNLHGTRSA